MASIFQIDGTTLITDKVTQVIPGYETSKIVKRLLSGDYHVQVIGTGARAATVTFLVTAAGKDIIDQAESQATPVRVEYGAKYLVGLIEAVPNWNFNTADLYQATIKILVSEEGAL